MLVTMETLSFSYSYNTSVGPGESGHDATNVNVSFTGDFITLDDLLERFADFVEHAGWIIPNGKIIGLVEV